MKKELLATVAGCMILLSCTDDSFTRSAAYLPEFSSPIVEMAQLLPRQESSVYRLMVYNRTAKNISIDNITVSGNDENIFSFNVDGHLGEYFSDIEIRSGDSVYVFIQAQAPLLADNYSCNVNFTTAGVTQTLPVTVPVIDAQIIESAVIDADTRWQGSYYIKGNLEVNKGSTLTLSEGTHLYFAENAAIIVEGTLESNGSASENVTLEGDRFDDIIPDVSYTVTGGQWSGIECGEESEVRLNYTSVLNAVNTINMSQGGRLSMFNSRLHNASGSIITADCAVIDGTGCELTDAAENILNLSNSELLLNNSTIANFYLLVYPSFPMINISGNTSSVINNSIIYGLTTEISEGDETAENYIFNNCLFQSPGTDDNNFLNCIWNTDPKLSVVRGDYIFDYTPADDSPAIGAANRALIPEEWTIDRLGNPTSETLPVGAYSR